MSNLNETIVSSTKIHDLNDDVLREVFKNINDFEMSAVADVCTTFGRTAEALFSSRFQQNSFSIYIPFTRKGESFDFRPLHSLLRRFGKSMQSLDISLNNRNPVYCLRVMKMVDRYCGEKLKELLLSSIGFTADLMPILRSLLSRIQTLRLEGCRFGEEFIGNEASEIFPFCSELRTLWIEYPKHLNWPVRVKLPKLESFSVVLDEAITNKNIETILELNPQLKEIKIQCCIIITSKIIQSITRYAPRIEKITICFVGKTHDFAQNLKHLKSLTLLKSLDLGCAGERISSVINELAAANIPLETLKIMRSVSDDELTKAIANLRRLKELRLERNTNMKASDVLMIAKNLDELTELSIEVKEFTGNDLLETIRSAPKLRKLELNVLTEYKAAILDSVWYMEISGVIATRRENSALEITLGKSVVNVPEEMLKAHHHLLKIRFA